jgi:hypothetical protein
MIMEWRSRAAASLAYFGMCGTEMHDIRTWRMAIGPKCCIEAPGNTRKEIQDLPFRMARMKMTAHAHGLGSGFQPLTAWVEDVILIGLDQDNRRPARTDQGESAEDTRFRYELYNLDFDGGFGFQKNDGDIRRVRALAKLFDRQAGQNFCLLLTVNVRDTIESIVDEYVKGLGRRKYGANWHELVDWHRDRAQDEHAFLLKAAVPLFIHRQAEARGFRPRCYPPIVYLGHNKATLVHFAFEFEYVGGGLAVGEQEELDLLTLPMLRAEDGAFVVVSRDAPAFDPDRCLLALTPLTDELRAGALSVPWPRKGRRR